MPATPSSGWREADTVIFDKTGTLTLPEPRVVNAAEIDPELLQMAARLALSSRHPLAVALAREAVSARALSTARSRSRGRACAPSIDGVEARLGSPAFCGLANVACAARRFAHRLRP